MSGSRLCRSVIVLTFGAIGITMTSCAVAPGGAYDYGSGYGGFYGADYGPAVGDFGFWGPGYRVAPFRGGHPYVAGGPGGHSWHGPVGARAFPSLPGGRPGRGVHVGAPVGGARGGGGRGGGGGARR